MRLFFGVALAWSVVAPLQTPSPISVNVTARALEPGEVVALTIHAPANVTITMSSPRGAIVPFRIDDTTWRALTGIDLDVPAGPYPLTITTDRPDEPPLTHTLTVGTKQFATRRLRVAPRYVEPPPAELDRVLEEARVLAAFFDTPSEQQLWDGPFEAPVPDAPNSAFGSRSVFNGQPRSPHGGADFASPTGRRVRAPNHGRVLLAGDLYYTGGTVVVDHGLGLVSLFAHLSRIDVKAGANVAKDDVLGLVGATGRVTGPHLHWTVRMGGARVDPLSLIALTARLEKETASAR